jgi:putative transcriptional regulator
VTTGDRPTPDRTTHNIVVHLDELLADREISLTELANRVGITIANLSILKNGRARAVRFSTLAALCRELQCAPGDILRYQPPAAADEETDAEPASDSR